jgi:hypothetical protein
VADHVAPATYFLQVHPVLMVLGVVSTAVYTPAFASTHIYRYDLPTPSCFVDQFREEIPPGASLAGKSWRVETDALGRPTRWESLRDGKPVYVYTARFMGNATKMAGWDITREGAPAGSYRCLSDARGKPRFEILDAAGKLTEYDLFSTVYSPALGKEIWTGYTPQGKPSLHDTGYFSPGGVLIRLQGDSIADSAEWDTEFNPNTGEVKSRKVLNAKSHQLQRVEKFTYDKNGDRIHAEIFDGNGVDFGRIDYAAGLERSRVYKRPNGTVETYQYGYDLDRQLKDATLSVNGKLVCKLVYTPESDGGTSKTEARGPDGTLWAVYPGRGVEEIAQDGRDPTNATSTVYRQGEWW